MNEDLISILCDESWYYDQKGFNDVLFRKDGTGEIVFRGETTIMIATAFHWKVFSQSINQGANNYQKIPHVIGQLDIEMTITKRRLTRWKKLDELQLNEAYLTEDAFMPKTYTICLEKGSFLTPWAESNFKKFPSAPPRYALRLKFDKSPYPPRHELKNPEGGPEQVKVWDWKEFCNRELPEDQWVGPTFWNTNCIVQ
ncbi:uncharacterized protein K452DRAFT_360039 [Aplosporella prunicola CBS 121167]|uniref:Uncharacterized protein n=1 Tax=Aplosporella prunicola CBS 121167 TaxID=1176127 RepID=A0A6A6B8E9_9PEZI|nr:uncharacterized protein K452DRAFT_360039 [Aplosporella prunicola CBS 121167]KAF2140429.1 hypothetical protein K452DRAFT_360039 [Aplosporella prunicola CBS 121167]